MIRKLKSGKYQQYSMKKDPRTGEGEANMMHISADMIDHGIFHSGSWLLPIERPVWYYFMQGSRMPVRYDRRLIESVDKPLRRLVSFLLEAGFATTPSCSGHDHPCKHFSRIYDSLQKDEHDIRDAGLRLAEIGNGLQVTFHDRRYCLPWSRSEFIGTALMHQLYGVIGINLSGHDLEAKRLLEIDWPGVSVNRDGSLVQIHTDTTEVGDYYALWRKVTGEVMRIMRQAQAS